jgi:hypothetical protein
MVAVFGRTWMEVAVLRVALDPSGAPLSVAVRVISK